MESADVLFAWDEQSAPTSRYSPAYAQEMRSSCQPKRLPQEVPTMAEHIGADSLQEHHFTNKIVKAFLDSNLSLILIVLATILGVAGIFITTREEDPQIVVPLADIYVNFPGHSAAEVEQLIATPLERILYQIDGVEFVYSMSR